MRRYTYVVGWISKNMIFTPFYSGRVFTKDQLPDILARPAVKTLKDKAAGVFELVPLRRKNEMEPDCGESCPYKPWLHCEEVVGHTGIHRTNNDGIILHWESTKAIREKLTDR